MKLLKIYFAYGERSMVFRYNMQYITSSTNNLASREPPYISDICNPVAGSNPTLYCPGSRLYSPKAPTNTARYTAILAGPIQYIPRNMHTVFALLCFVVVIHWLIFPYPSGLLHWHCGNLTIAPVPAKQPWWIWINTSCEFIMNDCITTTNKAQQNRVHISWDILFVFLYCQVG